MYKLRVPGMTVMTVVNILRTHNKAPQMTCMVETNMISLRAVNL